MFTHLKLQNNSSWFFFFFLSINKASKMASDQSPLAMFYWPLVYSRRIQRHKTPSVLTLLSHLNIRF